MNALPHLWTTGDGVSRGIMVCLALMSLASWTVMLLKLWQSLRLARQARSVQRSFWQPDGEPTAVAALAAQSANAYAALATAAAVADAHPLDGRPGARHRVDEGEWMSRCLRQGLDDIAAH